VEAEEAMSDPTDSPEMRTWRLLRELSGDRPRDREADVEVVCFECRPDGREIVRIRQRRAHGSVTPHFISEISERPEVWSQIVEAYSRWKVENGPDAA
jgi:hypothetical protein